FRGYRPKPAIPERDKGGAVADHEAKAKIADMTMDQPPLPPPPAATPDTDGPVLPAPQAPKPARRRAGSLSEGVTVIQAHLKTLPAAPGVYRMLDADGNALYVGKAKNLRRRVYS